MSLRDPDISWKIQNSGPVFRAHGSEVQIFHERSRTVDLVVHRWVRGPGIYRPYIKVFKLWILIALSRGRYVAANLTTTYASQILDLLGLSKFKGGQCPPAPPPDKNIPAPPPPELVPILKTYAKCAWPGPITPPPLGMWMMSHGHCPRGGGGVLVNVQEWGCFSIFRRTDDVTRTMSKGGGCLWMSSPPPGNPVSAPVYVPPIQVQTPPPPHLAGWLRACIL